MKLALQIVLGLLSLIPIAFAALGLAKGAGLYLDDTIMVAALDNQYRYNSGTYAVVSFLIWYAIPKVEQHFKLLAFVSAALFIGGLGRIISMLKVGTGTDQQFIGMFIELGSPLLLIWQQAVARKARA